MNADKKTLENALPGSRSKTAAPRPLLTRISERLSLAIVLAIAAMFLFIRIAHELVEGETFKIDTAAMTYFGAHHGGPLFAIMTAISWLAGPIVQACVLAACIIYFAATKRFWPQGGTMLIGAIGGEALIVGLKQLFHRPRPAEIFEHLGYSFPSGHSFFALITYGMLAYWLTREARFRRRKLAWGLAATGVLLVGFSRVFIGEHYPSDVVAGFLVALPWVWGCLAIGQMGRPTKDNALSIDSEEASF